MTRYKSSNYRSLLPSTKNVLSFLALAVACTILPFCSLAQTTTAISGTIKDLTGANVTSGQVTFDLQPGIDSTMSGIARFTPQTVTCTITAAGAVKALDGTSTCTITNNTSLQPTGTSWKVCIQPNNVTPGSCFITYATGTAIDLTTQIPTPPLTPGYNIVDTYSAQTIAGNKTFTGTTTFSNLALSAISPIGNLTVTQSTAATGSANQSSPTLCADGTYWTGAASAADAWCWQDVLGASGANPTTTYTLTHSGSSGTAAVSIPSNTTVGGTLGVTGAATAASLNLNSTGVLSTTAQSGTGSLCMTTSCSMTTPSIGAATATSINGLSIPGSGTSLVSDTAPQTLTNKRVTPRIVTMADATSVTPTSDTADQNIFASTQIAGTLTVNNPSGTPTDGQKLILRLHSTNAQTYSFGTAYAFSTSVTTPTTLAAGKTDYIGLIWDASSSKWDVVAVDQGH